MFIHLNVCEVQAVTVSRSPRPADTDAVDKDLKIEVAIVAFKSVCNVGCLHAVPGEHNSLLRRQPRGTIRGTQGTS